MNALTLCNACEAEEADPASAAGNCASCMATTTTPPPEEDHKMSATYWFAGGPRHPGTDMATNVRGDCPHRHRTPRAAARCVEADDRAVRAGHGRNAYSDRIVMIHDEHGARPWDSGDR